MAFSRCGKIDYGAQIFAAGVRIVGDGDIDGLGGIGNIPPFCAGGGALPLPGNVVGAGNIQYGYHGFAHYRVVPVNLEGSLPLSRHQVAVVLHRRILARSSKIPLRGLPVFVGAGVAGGGLQVSGGDAGAARAVNLPGRVRIPVVVSGCWHALRCQAAGGTAGARADGADGIAVGDTTIRLDVSGQAADGSVGAAGYRSGGITGGYVVAFDTIESHQPTYAAMVTPGYRAGSVTGGYGSRSPQTAD